MRFASVSQPVSAAVWLFGGLVVLTVPALADESPGGTSRAKQASAATPASGETQEANSQQAAKDRSVVETLLRLKEAKIEGNGKLEAAVNRHLATIKGTPRYFELIERWNLQAQSGELLALAQADPSSTAGVQAARLLLRFDDRSVLEKALTDPDDTVAANLATAIGLAGGTEALEILEPLVDDLQRTLAVRSAAVRGIGRNLNGQRRLLERVSQGQLTQDLHFAAANALYASTDEAVRREVEKHLRLPQAAGAGPLPPLASLVERKGDPDLGRRVFATHGTCAKCHKVRGEGKEVGPDLSEIGSKLSREALYVSVLDPSAGISHNYETFTIATNDGNIVSGIKISETDESVTLRTAEAIDHRISKQEIDELVKQPVSLMPADLQKAMSIEDLVGVVEYLTTLKKPEPAAATGGADFLAGKWIVVESVRASGESTSELGSVYLIDRDGSMRITDRMGNVTEGRVQCLARVGEVVPIKFVISGDPEPPAGGEARTGIATKDAAGRLLLCVSTTADAPTPTEFSPVGTAQHFMKLESQ